MGLDMYAYRLRKPTEKEIQQLKKFVQVRLNLDNLNMVNTQKEVAKK